MSDYWTTPIRCSERLKTGAFLFTQLAIQPTRNRIAASWTLPNSLIGLNSMGLLSSMISIVQQYWAPLILFVLITRLARNRYKPILREIPGPFLASLTDLWQFRHCVRRKANRDYELHRKYKSPLLRLGPNTISVADVEASRKIYGWKPVFKKVRTRTHLPY